MSAAAKKPPTKKIEVIINDRIFNVPKTKVKDVLKIVKKYEIEEVDTSWRELFNEELAEVGEAAMVLRGARGKENFTQEELSKLTGIKQSHISEMENGKRPIGRITAKKLAIALNIHFSVFL